MKTDHELGEEREKLINRLKLEMEKLQEQLDETKEWHREEILEIRRDYENEIEHAMESSRELLRILEEKFGRKIVDTVRLDLKCRRA